MANSVPLDIFTIGFETKGLKELEHEIAYNEKQLKRWEEVAQAIEGRLDELAKQGNINTDTYKGMSKELERVQRQTKKYAQTIDKLKNSNQYAFANMQKSFMKLIKTIGLFAVVRSTITKSLDFYEQAEQLDFLAKKTGIAAEKLQELGNASKRFGGTTEGTATSVENIVTNKAEYQKAGIQIEQDPSKTLENVARKMEKLKSDTEKWKLAESLGIDEATTRMLIEGVDKYNDSLKRSSKYKLYTKEDIQRMRDYRQIQQDIRDGTNNIFSAIYRMLLPAITAVSKVIRAITDWLAEHEGAVKIVSTLALIATAIGAVTLAVKELNIAFTFLSNNPVVRTILIIIAFLTTLWLIIDDFVGFLQGKVSVTGRILEKFGLNIDKVRNQIISLIRDIKNMWNAIPEPFKKALGGAVNFMGFGGTLMGIKAAKKQIIDYTNLDLNSVPTGAQSSYYNAQSQNQTNTHNSKSVANNQNKNVNANITINTQASDAKAVAREVQGTMNSLDNGQIG